MANKFSYLLIFCVGLNLSCSEKDNIPGSPPIADAGEYGEVELGVTISLDGSNSNDPDLDSLTYNWSVAEVPSGSTITTQKIGNRTKKSAFFTPDKVGQYNLLLTVNDGLYPPVSDEAIIIVVPTIGQPPVAVAGADQSVNVGIEVILDGSDSSDPDQDALIFSWVVTSNPVGANVQLKNAETAKASFTPSITGIYNFELKVTDITNKSDTDQIIVTVK